MTIMEYMLLGYNVGFGAGRFPKSSKIMEIKKEDD